MTDLELLKLAKEAGLILTAERETPGWSAPLPGATYPDRLGRFVALVLAEALAEQKPVAWRGYTITNGYTLHFHYGEAHRVSSKIEPLYTAPQPKAEQQEPKKDLMWSTVAMQRRHDERIGRIVNTLEQIKQEQLAEQPASLDWVSLNKAADEIVRSKPTWKRFIDGTPLANDIACWMADFALEHTAPQPAKREPLTDAQICSTLTKAFPDDVEPDGSWKLAQYELDIFRIAERAHGIGEKPNAS